MNVKDSIFGSFLAFIIATSCCWLPALIITIGGGSTLISLSNGIEKMSGVFMTLGVTFLGFGVYQFYKKRKPIEVILASMITCPNCAHQKEEQMPTNACQFFYECENCKQLLKPLKGDCCVFCSYATVACPPIQLEEDCC